MEKADLEKVARMAEKITNRIAIVPGSFDPLTVGHVDIIERAAKIFDEVVVAILVNPEKVNSAMFSFEERKRIATVACSHICNVRVITFEGMLWKLAKMLGACAIVKGLRNAADFEYEQPMAAFNYEHYPLAETVYLPSYVNNDVSSTALRTSIKQGSLPSEMLTPELESIIKIVLSEKGILL